MKCFTKRKAVGFILICVFASAVCTAGERKIQRLQPFVFKPYDYERLEREYRAAHPKLPRMVTRNDIAAVSDPDTAEKIDRIGRLVYRYYSFNTSYNENTLSINNHRRFPIPTEYAEFFSKIPSGYCDGATALVISLLQEDEIPAESFNFVVPIIRVPDPIIAGVNFKHSGHTITRVKLARGAILIDPTYGLVFITHEPDFNAAVFASKKYEVFSIFDTPDPTLLLSPFMGLLFYDHASQPTAFAGPSSTPIVAIMPVIKASPMNDVQIGSIDGSNNDIERAFGSFVNHIGFWYQSTKHVWRFAPQAKGKVRITFHLLDGEKSVLKNPLQVGIDVLGAQIISMAQQTESPDMHIVLLLDVSGPFSIEFTSQTPSARLLDAVTVQYVSG
jgi:hypothetical protein